MASARTWTSPLVARLIELWPTRSAADIAEIITKELGVTVSRNAVIGKANSLKLQKDPTAPAKQRERMAKLAPVISALPFVPRIVDTAPRLLTLLELTDDTCKYECTDSESPADYRFCGNPIHKGSYCRAHYRLCVHPAPEPKFRAFVGGKRAA